MNTNLSSLLLFAAVAAPVLTVLRVALLATSGG